MNFWWIVTLTPASSGRIDFRKTQLSLKREEEKKPPQANKSTSFSTERTENRNLCFLICLHQDTRPREEEGKERVNPKSERKREKEREKGKKGEKRKTYLEFLFCPACYPWDDKEKINLFVVCRRCCCCCCERERERGLSCRSSWHPKQAAAAGCSLARWSSCCCCCCGRCGKCLTWHFAVLMPQKPGVDGFCAMQNRRSTDF